MTVPNAPMALALRASRFVHNDNTVAVSLTAGVIMRRRSRHTSTNGEPPEWPATTVDDSVDANTQLDVPLDQALRALARLLARQAARELFELERAEEVKCSERLP